jgi:hypothetical protein
MLALLQNSVIMSIVKPQYEQYRANGKGAEFKGVRIPTQLLSQIERLAEIEGLARVVEDRLNPENVAATVAAIRAQTESQVAAMQQLADERIAAMQEMGMRIGSQDE